MSNLAQSPLEQRVRIRTVGGDPAFRRRLLELGFLPGVEVRVVGVAPMGDPLSIEVRGCRFSIRRSEAQAISVASPAAVPLPIIGPLAAAVK